jgi:hypothetical protein
MVQEAYNRLGRFKRIHKNLENNLFYSIQFYYFKCLKFYKNKLKMQLHKGECQ